MLKPYTLPSGEVIDIHQSYGNLPKNLHHWIYQHIPSNYIYKSWGKVQVADHKNLLYWRESVDAWWFITWQSDNLCKDYAEYGNVYSIHDRIDKCHEKIFELPRNPDKLLLLYKLYCHVQRWDLAIEPGIRRYDFNMRPEFNNDRTFTSKDDFSYNWLPFAS